MDVDPLADRPPPRHAIESDSEDEPDFLRFPDSGSRNIQRRQAELPVSVVWIQNVVKGKINAILALEPVSDAITGAFDFQGWKVVGNIKLGEEEIGQIIHSSTHNTLFTHISNSSRIGIYSSRTFAQSILKELPSNSILIIDSYPLPTYISISSSLSSPQLDQSPPIRYLTTLPNLPNPIHSTQSLKVEPFTPPNLLTSPTAAFLSLSARQPTNPPTTALLLPARHTSPVIREEEEWETNMLRGLLEYAFDLLGIRSAMESVKNKTRDDKEKKTTRKASRFSESGMYL